MEPTEFLFAAGLVVAYTAGAVLQLRGALVVAAAITVSRYALAVATWGFDGPNDQAPLRYAAFAIVLIGVFTLGATAAGVLTRRGASAVASARRT